MKKIFIAVSSIILVTSCSKKNGTVVPNPVDTTGTPKWAKSFSAGSNDANGQFMGGNEIMFLVPHKGKIYAGNSYWMESNTAIPKAVQVLVLDNASAAWKVDKNFTTDNLRMTSLASLTFTTDKNGNAITPDNVLIAVPTNNQGQLHVYTRNDATNTWNDDFVKQFTVGINCRAVITYKDPVTNITKIFLGLRDIGVLAGTYDASVPGKIIWDTNVELAVPADERILGYAIANGKLFVSTGSTTGTNDLGLIYTRTNGSNPTWNLIHTTEQGGNTEDLRGLTAIQNPNGNGSEVLLFSWRSIVRRLDPLAGNAVVQEANLAEKLSAATGQNFSYVLAAYNDFFKLPSTITSQTEHIVGFEGLLSSSQNPLPSNVNRWATDGRYFVRKQLGSNITYEMKYIVNNQATVSDTLVASRTFCVSPFPEHNGKTIYAGGYDANSIPASNKAWIYRGDY
jgi:poly(A) polymerase